MYTLSKDQKHALDMMLRGENVIITGEAGVGKTAVISEFREVTKKNVIVVAPTGVAALNAKGQTINSFFMLPPGLLIPDQLDPIPWKRKLNVIRQVDTIIIDEISMVRSDMLAAIDQRCREAAVRGNRFKPFGGKQVILCGDFFQLSPIVGDKIEDDWLHENMGGEYAFETKLWKMAGFKPAVLSTQFRQKDDAEFLSILNAIRHGDIESEAGKALLDKLNAECAKPKRFEHEPIRLCTTNREVQAVNNAARAKVNNPFFHFKAVVSGKFDQSNYPTEELLSLKVGVRVMILVNKHQPKDGGFIYVNGDVGTIIDIKQGGIENRVLVQLDSGKTVSVGLHEWANTKYVLDKDVISGKKVIRQETIGTFMQLPLRLAYAMTIHKSQGMTLERVDLRLGGGCFAHGQLYTALSRCKSLDGLMLERPITSDDLILDDRVVDFYADLEREVPQQADFFDTLEVPIEYADKMKAYLNQLKSSSQQSIPSPVEMV